MIRGIGNDIIEIDRIDRIIREHGDRFLNRLFSETERAYCLKHVDSHRHFAGRFAAKEAIVKALGIGFREGVSWLDIEIINDTLGRPHVHLSPSLLERLGHPQLLVSISHCRSHATATAVWDS